MHDLAAAVDGAAHGCVDLDDRRDPDKRDAAAEGTQRCGSRVQDALRDEARAGASAEARRDAARRAAGTAADVEPARTAAAAEVPAAAATAGAGVVALAGAVARLWLESGCVRSGT